MVKCKIYFGEIVAKIDRNGTVKNANGEKIMQISDDGKFKNPAGDELKWDEEGIMYFSKDQHLSIYPYDKNLRKTASFIFVLYITI
jgi:hypothetical protein